MPGQVQPCRLGTFGRCHCSLKSECRRATNRPTAEMMGLGGWYRFHAHRGLTDPGILSCVVSPEVRKHQSVGHYQYLPVQLGKVKGLGKMRNIAAIKPSRWLAISILHCDLHGL